MERKAKSGIMLTLLIISMLTLAFDVPPVKASGTIYIRADGSIDPPTAPIQRDGDIYTFTDNINDSIIVERNSITMDGNGYTLQSPLAGSGYGFDLTSISNVTIRNTNIKNFFYGIYLNLSSFSTVFGNNITNNTRFGICLNASSSNTISGNNITESNQGVHLGWSNYNIVLGNNITNGTLYGGYAMTGVSVLYSNNTQVSGNNITNYGYGIQLGSASNITVSRNNITKGQEGVMLSGSSNNTVSENNIANYIGNGIYLHWYNDYNTFSRNTITNSSSCGISLVSVNKYNIFSGNNITNSGSSGVHLFGSHNNTFSGNNITSNLYGVYLSSFNNTFSGNNMVNNQCGAYLESCPYPRSNIFHHNNFIHNTVQVYSASNNTWDDAYPSGGNYWSDYAGVDVKSGPNQNQPGSDGIGDTPYVIDADNRDRYPFMNPWTPQAYDIATVNVTPFKTVVGRGYTLHINVTVTNQGCYTQTFKTTTYSNTTIIETKTATLENGASTTIAFTWDTSGFVKGNYTISAYAWPVPGETDTTDNTLTDGWIIVAMIGDLTGPEGYPEGKCDMRDVYVVARAFGSHPTHPRWNPNADITGTLPGAPDEKVDMRDVYVVARNFGKTDP